MPEGQREAWTELLLAFVLREDTPSPLRAAAGAALGGAAPAASIVCSILALASAAWQRHRPQTRG
jgi:hypothetical protein